MYTEKPPTTDYITYELSTFVSIFPLPRATIQINICIHENIKYNVHTIVKNVIIYGSCYSHNQNVCTFPALYVDGLIIGRFYSPGGCDILWVYGAICHPCAQTAMWRAFSATYNPPIAMCVHVTSRTVTVDVTAVTHIRNVCHGVYVVYTRSINNV